MASQPLGSLIWISVRPMLRLVLCASTGFIITKCGLLPQVAARGAGQIMLNIALPSLFFSKIVPAFTPANISNLGPLVLVCVLYQLIGFLTCLAILPFFWVPHRFRWGFIVAGVWGNYGDVPTAVIMSITAAAPFDGTEDQNLAVAYIAAFVLVFMVGASLFHMLQSFQNTQITLFPMGGHHLVARDFRGPEREDEEIRLSFAIKSMKSLGYLVRFSHRWNHTPANHDIETLNDQDSREYLETEEKSRNNNTTSPPLPPSRSTFTKVISKHVTLRHENSTVTPSEINSVSPVPASPLDAPSSAKEVLAYSPLQQKLLDRFFKKSLHFLQSLLTVPTMSVIGAFIISVVQPLKGLFVLLPSSPHAPDGQPPLAFMLDTATFLGGASVPLGLICLGSALARLSVPRSEWRNLPIGSIMGLALGRLVLQPILGVLIVRGLTNVGVIPADDKVLQFVCIFFSCVPTATTQVFLTQVYSGTGAAEHISAFLLPQFVLMFISSTVLTAYSLHLLFG